MSDPETQWQPMRLPLIFRPLEMYVNQRVRQIHQKLTAAGFRPMGDGAMSDSYIYDCSSEKSEMEAIKVLTEAMQMPQEIIPENAVIPTGGISAHITSALNYAQELLGSGRKIEAQILVRAACSPPHLMVTERSVKSGGSLSFAMPLDHIFHFHPRGLGEYFLEQMGNPHHGSAGKRNADGGATDGTASPGSGV